MGFTMSYRLWPGRTVCRQDVSDFCYAIQHALLMRLSDRSGTLRSLHGLAYVAALHAMQECGVSACCFQLKCCFFLQPAARTIRVCCFATQLNHCEHASGTVVSMRLVLEYLEHELLQAHICALRKAG
jgi:hypothetical protein